MSDTTVYVEYNEDGTVKSRTEQPAVRVRPLLKKEETK